MYITEKETKIKAGLKQVFQNKFTNSISKNEVIKMKNDGILRDRDLLISKFLFNFRFATLEQIYEYLRLNGYLKQETPEGIKETSINSIKSRLEKLVQNRIINKFILTDDENDRFKQDAMVIYCLDLGGKFLLSNYTEEDTSDWYTPINMKGSDTISKDLTTVQIYLKIIDCAKGELIYFETYPIRKYDKLTIIPNFEFAIKVNGETKYFIGEVTREADFPINFSKKIAKIEKLVETNAWKKYYLDTEDSPVLFVVAEDVLTANDAGKITTMSTGIQKVRFTIDEKLKNEDLSLSFMKYVPDQNKLKIVKSMLFNKEQ